MAKAAKQRVHGTLRPRLSSCSSLFEQRGDKWGGSNRPLLSPHIPSEAEKAAEDVLQRKGQSGQYVAEEAYRKAFAQREDPDFDQFIKATKAQEKREYRQPVGAAITATPKRKVANVLRRMHHKMQPKRVKVADRKSKPGLAETDDEAKIIKLVQSGLSREKAIQTLAAERKEIATRRADYAARKFGR